MLYGLEFFFLVRELKDIEGYFVDNFYELGKGRFRIKLAKSGAQINILCMLPYSLSKTSILEHASAPTNFSIAVRKRINGFKLTSISQLNNDRIIIAKLQKGDERLSMIFELFGRGNLIIANESMQIMLAYVQHQFKDRSTFVNRQYAAPASDLVDISSNDSIEKALVQLSGSESGMLADALQKRLQLGKPYIQQMLEDMKIEKNVTISSFDAHMQKMFSESLSNYINGAKGFYLYLENNIPVDFSVGMLSKYKKLEQKVFTTLSETLVAFYESEPAEQQESAEEKELSKSIEKQKEIIAQIDNDILENKKIATFIFSNMSEINRIIEIARSNKHITKEELQKASKIARIKDVDLKNKTITIESND